MPPRHSFQSFIKCWCYRPHISDKGTDVQKGEVASLRRIKAVSCLEVKSLSRVWLFATLWTLTYQAPPSMGFSRQECWSGLPFPSPGDLPDPGIEPRLPHCRQTLYRLSHQGSFSALFKHQTATWGGFCYSFHCQVDYFSSPFPTPQCLFLLRRGLHFLFTGAWLSHVEGERKWQVSLLSRSFEILCPFCHLSFFFAIRLTTSQTEAVQSIWG